MLRILSLALSLAVFVVATAHAQPASRTPRIGFVMFTPAPSTPRVDAFRQGLREFGWIEGQNVIIDWRFADGQPARIPDFIAEFVRLKVDVIVAGGGTPAARAAMKATSVIPIVTPVVADAVGEGLVASLARPGGNLTGLSMLDPEVTAKRMQLLKEALPKASRVAVLRDPERRTTHLPPIEAAARSLGLQLQLLEARTVDELGQAFEAARKARADAIAVLASAFLNAHRAAIVELAMRYRLPAMYEHREFSEAGGLISYGPNILDMYRRAGGYVDRILKGARPADLPIEQPTRFELVINLGTARTLGLSVPQSLLQRADEVIQ